MSERLATLAAIETALWSELQQTARDKQHAWRNAVLATVDADGDGADARTVIVREVDAERKRLLIFTDTRAAKVAQLLSHPRATLVMWSAGLGWQLRCKVMLTADGSGLAATSRWARIRLTPAAHDYLSREAPGAPLASTSQAGVPDRACFGVIEARVLAVDWLELHREGHRRAVFDADGGRWLQP